MTQAELQFEPVRQRPRTHNELVLDLLREFDGRWVDRPYRRLSVMWHSRIADLRKRGHVIESRCFEGDHQYRLVKQ